MKDVLGAVRAPAISRVGAETESAGPWAATLLQNSPLPAGCANISSPLAVRFFRDVSLGDPNSSESLYPPQTDFLISAMAGPGFKLHIPTPIRSLPCLSTPAPSLLHSRPHSGQSYTSSGLAHGQCLFPGFPPAILTPSSAQW